MILQPPAHLEQPCERSLITRTVIVKTCGKAENDEAKSGNDEAKGVPGRRGVTEGDGR